MFLLTSYVSADLIMRSVDNFPKWIGFFSIWKVLVLIKAEDEPEVLLYQGNEWSKLRAIVLPGIVHLHALDDCS